MSKQFENDLNRVFDQFDANRAKQHERQQAQKREEDEFLIRFGELRKNVIQPAFERIGALLKARGHDSRIVQEEYSVQPDGKVNSSAAIALVIVPAGTGRLTSLNRTDMPRLEFAVYSPNKKKITLYISTIGAGRGGSAGARGDHAIETITETFIETQALDLLREVLGR